MGFLERAIRRGVSDAVGKAIGGAVKDAVQPTAEKYANRAAQHIDEAAAAANQSAQQTRQAAGELNTAANTAAGSGGFANLEGALGNLQRSMESYATEAAKNMKTCPACGETTTADKKFCPSCGARLPEQTVAQGSVCPACGKQNTVGTRFCAECGTKLPAAVAEEQAEADKNAAVMAQWDEMIPQYPRWQGGGKRLELVQVGQNQFQFTADFNDHRSADAAVRAYRAYAQTQGFVPTGDYASEQDLYKRVDGVWYRIDTTHLYEGDDNVLDIYFYPSEPVITPPRNSGNDGLGDVRSALKNGLGGLFR